MKLIVFIILLFPGFINSYGNDYKILIKKGDEFYNKFDLRNAILLYEEAYKYTKDDYDVLLRLARTFNDLGEDYFEVNEKGNAEAAFNTAVKYAEIFYLKFPDSAKVYTLIAMSYGNLALFKGGNEKIKLANKIRENAEKSIKLNPNDYLPYIILGIYNREIASLSWFERAFANTFFGKIPDGSLQSAEKYITKALEINPGIITAMFNLSLVYREIDNEQKEIYWLKKIVDAPISDFRDRYSKRKAKERLNKLLN